ncbi:hypothetical protein FHG87_025543 [Trinorchestia longiramus]|nr:hypothetical protein FHG87_025543 [Trinorchestia longiramus]
MASDGMVKNVSWYVRLTGSSRSTSLKGKGLKEIFEYAEKEMDDIDESMMIFKDDNGLLTTRSEETSVQKHEACSSFLDMDDLIQAGCFSGDGVHLLQEVETKLSQRFICWIRATHLLMGGRMD